MTTKIITHAGHHHLDEVTAVALLKIEIKDVEIIRTFDKAVWAEGQANPDVYVLDIGRIHDVDNRNFDHHQNENLPATNMMIAEYLGLIGISPKLDSFLQEISNHDTTGCYKNQESALSSLIKMYKFDEAVELMVDLLSRLITEAHRYSDDMEFAETLTRHEVDGGFIIEQDPSRFIFDWRDTGAVGQLSKDFRSEDKWCLKVAKSDELNIQPSENQTFLHNSRHFATYTNKETAMAGFSDIKEVA